MTSVKVDMKMAGCCSREFDADTYSIQLQGIISPEEFKEVRISDNVPIGSNASLSLPMLPLYRCVFPFIFISLCIIFIYYYNGRQTIRGLNKVLKDGTVPWYFGCLAITLVAAPCVLCYICYAQNKVINN